MQDRYSPHRWIWAVEANIRQYKEIWEHRRAEDRKKLYQYEVPPWEEGQRQPYDIWEDIASYFDLENLDRLIDFGTNEADFYRTLREGGFKAEADFIGIDNQGSSFKEIENSISADYPESRFHLIEANAENLKNTFLDNVTPATSVNFMVYHAGLTSKVMSEAHRITRPGGKVSFASREPDNQIETWELARILAHSSGYVFPQEVNPSTHKYIPNVPLERITVYSHFSLSNMRLWLQKSPKYKVLHAPKPQKGCLWIPDTEEGWNDVKWAVISLMPYTVNRQLMHEGILQPPTEDEIPEIDNNMESLVRPLFEQRARQTQIEEGLNRPYFKITVHQGFFYTEVIK